MISLSTAYPCIDSTASCIPYPSQPHNNLMKEIYLVRGNYKSIKIHANYGKKLSKYTKKSHMWMI